MWVPSDLSRKEEIWSLQHSQGYEMGIKLPLATMSLINECFCVTKFKKKKWLSQRIIIKKMWKELINIKCRLQHAALEKS